MADMTKTTLDVFLPEVWSAKTTVTYRTNTVLEPLMDHTWEPELGVGKGDTINIPGFTQNQRTDVNARSTFGTGAAITFNANTEAQIQLAVNKMPIYAYRIPVEMSLQVQPGYIAKFTKAGGEAIAQYVDYDLASDGTDGLDYFTAIGADNVDVTEDIILDGETNLNNVNAPNDNRYFVYSPSTRASLMQIESLRNQLYASFAKFQGNKGAGYQGTILTLDCYMSNNLEAGTAGKKNAIFHKEAIAYAAQQNVKWVNQFNLADGLFNEYACYMCYGRKMIKGTFGREVDGK
jgi:hypothetical protein